MTQRTPERPDASSSAVLDKLKARENVFGDTTMKLAKGAEVGVTNFFAMAPQLNAEKSKELAASLLKVDQKGTSELDARWLKEIDPIATALEGYEQERPESAKGKAQPLEVSLAGERAKRLRVIGMMLESVRDERGTKRGGFNLSNLATAAGTELMQTEKTITDLLKFTVRDARHPLQASLRQEHAYLRRLLARCGVPNDPRTIMAMREAAGFGPAPGSQQAKDKHDITQGLRVLGCFAFGGLAILSGLIGYFGNKNEPKLKLMFIYLGLAGLCVAGKKPFLGTKEEAARDNIAFLGTPEFLNIAGPYGRGLAPVMERLFAERGDALKNVKTLLPNAQAPDKWREFAARMEVLRKAEDAKKAGKPVPPDGEPKDKNEERAFDSWKNLRTPVTNGREILRNRMTPELLLLNDFRFVQFLKLTLEKTQNGKLDGAVLRTLRDAKGILPEPPARYGQLTEGKGIMAN